MKKGASIFISDSTLRDGSHAIRHQFTKEQISAYAAGAEKAGVPLVVVGHGNGLGASSLQLGFAKLTDVQMLTAARRQLKNTKLGAFLIPGFGTIKDDIEPACKAGLDVLVVGCHCSEANTTRQHLEYAKSKGLQTYGVLMMVHMLSPKELLEQAKLMQEYGASAVLMMDSAGNLLPGDVTARVDALASGMTVDVGFHAHNNLGMAIANSVAAVEAGATIIDCTSGGLGAGAGNCQMEVLVAVLEKMGYQSNVNLYQLMDNSENIIAPIMKKHQTISALSLVSGLAGVFSGFAPHARRAAEHFGVDVRDILVELGKRKVVAGQEDLIVDVATYLAAKKKKNDADLQIEALM